jgi:hypothetical protein
MGEWGRSSLESVEHLTGIGPRLAGVLDGFGFGSVQELSGLHPGQADALAEVVAGVSPAGMRRAVAEAAFHLVGSDGALLAATLVDNGITSLLELLAAPTQRVVNLGGGGWDTARAAVLQLDAARARLTFQVLLRVLDGDGAPVGLPRVEVADSGLADIRPVVMREGDDQGWVVTPPLRRDRVHHVFVVVSGHRRVLRVNAGFGPVQRRTMVLSAPPRRGPVAPAQTLVVGPAYPLVDEIGLGQAQDGQVFRVGPTQGAEVPLRAMVRSFVPGGVITEVMAVPTTALPAGSVEGSYVVVEAGALRAARDDERDDALRSRGGLLAGRLRP